MTWQYLANMGAGGQRGAWREIAPPRSIYNVLSGRSDDLTVANYYFLATDPSAPMIPLYGQTKVNLTPLGPSTFSSFSFPPPDGSTVVVYGNSNVTIQSSPTIILKGGNSYTFPTGHSFMRFVVTGNGVYMTEVDRG